MTFISYNAELALANILFQRVFSNIQIERTDKNGNTSWLKVPCVMGQRSRILKSLENAERRSMYKFPMIVINRTGYQRQGDRLNSLHNEVKYEISSKRRLYEKLTPVPIDISYDVSVMAKYQADIDKIASNFMVFFNSNIFVSQEHPKYEGVKLNNEIIMSDSVSEEHPDELDPSADDIVTSNFSFTFKTYLFGGTSKAKRRTHALSTVMTQVVSSYVYEFQNDDAIREFLDQSGGTHAPLSTTLTAIVEVPSQVETDLSSPTEEYDDGVPAIRTIDFGFYAVPKYADIDQYILSVDNEQIAKHGHFTVPAYLSSERYFQAKGRDGKTVLSTEGDVYGSVDNWCTLAPYVDRIRWKIDESLSAAFPDNFKPYGDLV